MHEYALELCFVQSYFYQNLGIFELNRSFFVHSRRYVSIYYPQFSSRIFSIHRLSKNLIQFLGISSQNFTCYFYTVLFKLNFAIEPY